MADLLIQNRFCEVLAGVDVVEVVLVRVLFLQLQKHVHGGAVSNIEPWIVYEGLPAST